MSLETRLQLEESLSASSKKISSLTEIPSPTGNEYVPVQSSVIGNGKVKLSVLQSSPSIVDPIITSNSTNAVQSNTIYNRLFNSSIKGSLKEAGSYKAVTIGSNDVNNYLATLAYNTFIIGVSANPESYILIKNSFLNSDLSDVVNHKGRKIGFHAFLPVPNEDVYRSLKTSVTISTDSVEFSNLDPEYTAFKIISSTQFGDAGINNYTFYFDLLGFNELLFAKTNESNIWTETNQFRSSLSVHNNLGAEFVIVDKGGNHTTRLRPRGMVFNESNVVLGSLKVTLDSVGLDQSRISFELHIVPEGSGNLVVCYISGVRDNVARKWSECSAIFANRNKNYVVRFGYESSKPVVYIGELTDNWKLSQNNIRMMAQGLNHQDISNIPLIFDISIEENTFSDITQTITDRNPITQRITLTNPQFAANSNIELLTAPGENRVYEIISITAISKVTQNYNADIKLLFSVGDASINTPVADFYLTDNADVYIQKHRIEEYFGDKNGDFEGIIVNRPLQVRSLIESTGGEGQVIFEITYRIIEI